MGENPWELRQPPGHIGELSKKQLRAMVLAAVAMGNDPQMPSALLHATGSIPVIRKLLGERRWLYSNWLVRWPKVLHDVPYIEFGDKKLYTNWWLDDWDSDTEFLQDHMGVMQWRDHSQPLKK